MRRLTAAFVLMVLAAGLIVFFASSGSRTAAAQPPPDRPARPPGWVPWEALNQDSLAADRDSMTKAVLEHIAGRENVAAESVFKNVKVWRGLSAEHLVRAMDLGLSKSLGVGCRYCHIPDHWADDDKTPKKVARDMMRMTEAIYDTLLPRVYNPDNDHRVVNCGTCHHGHRNPNWEMMRNRPGGPPPGR